MINIEAATLGNAIKPTTEILMDKGFSTSGAEHKKQFSASEDTNRRKFTTSKNETIDSSVSGKEEQPTRKTTYAPTRGMEESFKELSPLFDEKRYYSLFPYMQADPVLKDSSFYHMASYAFDEPGERHEYTSMQLTDVVAKEQIL
ncbi:MAG: hypothetical protein SPG10_16965 [Enterocloster clostridioformis]|nr:hypothetical protein [Enterocloster clostridioformis]